MNTPAQHHTARIRRNMQLTMENMVRVNNRITEESDNKTKAKMQQNNDHRQKALDEMERKLLQ